MAYLVEKLAPALQYSWHTETTASDGGPNNMVINELQVTGLRFKKKDQKWHAVCNLLIYKGFLFHVALPKWSDHYIDI